MDDGYVKDTDGNRPTLMVGGFPAGSARDATAQMLDYLGPTLLYAPGQRGDNWIAPELAAVPSLPGVLPCDLAGGYTGCDDIPWYAATSSLIADDFDPVVILARAFQASYPVFGALRSERGLAHLRFQAGLPAAVDLAWLAFREAGLGADLFNMITTAKAWQVLACHAQAPGDVVFQLETPVATRMVATADDPATIAAYVAGLLTDLPRLCPGTAWGVHLSLGGWAHQAAVDPATALPLVILAREIIAQWPAGPEDAGLEYIHIPCAAAGKPPAGDAEWYAPLAALRRYMPRGCALSAGLVHEDLDLTVLRRLLGVIEDAYGARVRISTTCGLGRWPGPAQPVDAMTKMRDLAAT